MGRHRFAEWQGGPGAHSAIRSKYWLVDGKVLCTVPRAASSSMNESLAKGFYHRDLKRIRAPEVLDEKNNGTKILMWHRDPLDRYGSAYHLLGRNNPDEFAERVLTQSNPHWDPQIDFHSHNGTFLPTQVYRFEDLVNTWYSEFDVQLSRRRINTNRPNWKQVSKKMSSNYIIGIMNKYEDDILFHENIQ